MKKTFTTVAVLLCCTLLHAQSTKAETEIRLLEQMEHQAILKGDVETLQRLFAPAFTVNTPRNNIANSSKEVTDMVSAGTIKYSSFTRDVEKVVLKGDVAITMGSETVVPAGSSPQAGQAIKRRFTNIWMRENNQWMLVARHASVICQ